MTRTGASTRQFKPDQQLRIGSRETSYFVLYMLNLQSSQSRYFSSFSFDLSYFFTIFAYYIYYYGKD